MRPVKPEPEDQSVPAPEAAVKTEVIDDQTAVNELFRLVQSIKDGIEMDHVAALTPALTNDQKQMAINSLLSSKRLVLVKEGSILKLKVNESTQLEGVTEEEQAVYSLIEESKTKGIWIKELRDNTGLAVSIMRKVLKSLENKKLIKTVKAVGTTKKCYMLTSFEPDTSLTGGTFYSDHQLDSELIHTLVSVCTSFLQSKRKTAVDQFPNDSGMQKELSYVRPQEVASYISEKGVLNCQISLEDIERILEVALLDGTIERRSDGKIRATPIQQLVSPLVCIPCGICPMINDCKPGHVISPETCRYMADWLHGK